METWKRGHRMLMLFRQKNHLILNMFLLDKKHRCVIPFLPLVLNSIWLAGGFAFKFLLNYGSMLGATRLQQSPRSRYYVTELLNGVDVDVQFMIPIFAQQSLRKHLILTFFLSAIYVHR